MPWGIWISTLLLHDENKELQRMKYNVKELLSNSPPAMSIPRDELLLSPWKRQRLLTLTEREMSRLLMGIVPYHWAQHCK
mmetsp:Transcript_4210/g.6581  ORF Transcript_4210/g.6581 Transcript_4210/m.6581 type:complete len:80 (+) Transcript_4210:560-799(+)